MSTLFHLGLLFILVFYTSSFTLDANHIIKLLRCRNNRPSPTRTRSFSFLHLYAGGSAEESNKESIEKSSLQKLAIVGAGPSGLLLSHLLLKNNNHTSGNNGGLQITLLDGRSDPRKHLQEKTTNNITSTKKYRRAAYALGLGIRGKTAIHQGVDSDLWEAVKSKGFESERFQLHLGNFVLPLRSEENTNNNSSPSLLIYQSELCAALTEELFRRYEVDEIYHQEETKASTSTSTVNTKVSLLYDTKVKQIDLENMKLYTEQQEEKEEEILGPFDLIVGCDGVNSIVRSSMMDEMTSRTKKEESSSGVTRFESVVTRLPGEFKVVQADKMPSNVDPKSVSLIIPGGAFVEPTDQHGGCCILFSSSRSRKRSKNKEKENPLIYETQNKTAILESLAKLFPKWENLYETIAEQLMSQTKPGTASSVQCNTYHYQNKTVLVGDAAHATGGVSGQGVNSALMDSVILSQCILSNNNNKTETLPLAQKLLQYSMKQVPEGKSLYDLSFGPNPTKGIRKVQYTLRTIRDFLFGGRYFGIGKPILQTRLTTKLEPFVNIRRELDKYYDEPFPGDSSLNERLLEIHNNCYK